MFDKVLPRTKNQKMFFCQYYLKAEGCSISEHPGIIPWPKILRKKFVCEHRQCSFTAQKKKEKHHSKWLTPLKGMIKTIYWTWFWGVNIFWFGCLGFFDGVATILGPYLARPHIWRNVFIRWEINVYFFLAILKDLF